MDGYHQLIKSFYSQNLSKKKNPPGSAPGVRESAEISDNEKVFTLLPRDVPCLLFSSLIGFF